MKLDAVASLVVGFAAITAVVGTAPGALAGPLTGDSISAYFAQPNTSTPYTGICGNSPPGCFSSTSFTVGPGVETTFDTYMTPVANIDFSNDNLTITEITTTVAGNYHSPFQGLVFTDSTSTFDPIASVTGLPAALVSESGNQLYVDLGTAATGFVLLPGQQIIVGFAASIPEPPTWTVLLLGLGGLASARWLRQRGMSAR